MTKLLVAILSVLWALGALFVLWQFAQNGRYQTAQGEGRYILTDTRTGAVYIGTLPYAGMVHQTDSLHVYSFPIR